MLSENIALNKPAWRSHNDTRWLPSNAVDGNTNTGAYVYNDGLGDGDYRDFVAVDLGRSLTVGVVLLKLSVTISECVTFDDVRTYIRKHFHNQCLCSNCLSLYRKIPKLENIHDNILTSKKWNVFNIMSERTYGTLCTQKQLLHLWQFQVNVVFTWSQFWPSGIIVACVSFCLCPCVCAYQPKTCRNDDFLPSHSRVTKFGTEVQNTLVKIHVTLVILGFDWIRTRSNWTEIYPILGFSTR